MDLKILCVDDSKSVHAFLKQCVLEVSQSVESAYDGQQAIDLFKSSPQNYDVIFLDWEMPIKNGPETFEQLKKMGVTVPVIMLTSKNSAENIGQMLSAGVAEYIMKPFTKEILVEKIQSVLGIG
jgi:DNA-binding response OmpR family regulator